MDEGYRLNVRACLFQLLHFLMVNYRSEYLKTMDLGSGKKDTHIAAVLDYINENYKQSITLEDLAKREFMSVHYLSKLFKSRVDMGFLDYIGKKRLESAVKELPHLMVKSSVAQNKTNRDTIQLDFLQKACKVA